MEFMLNDLPRQVDAPQLLLQELLDVELPQRQQGIAVAVNDRVIPKSRWPHTEINAQDRILIITATQGG